MNQQVQYLEDKNHLSEFNVKYANAQLEILQKQLALENARQNKNQMKLQRDTQGNYRYVYAADVDNVRDKEADLLQEEMDAYNMSNENRMNTMSEFLTYYQNYLAQREELSKRALEGDSQAKQDLAKLDEDMVRDMEAFQQQYGDSVSGMIESLK